MTIQAPTRITIEVHQPDPDGGSAGQAPIVHVYPESVAPSQPAIAAEPRLEQRAPAAFDPGECHCLDPEDCNADHAND